jgi:hypothetical protein
MISDVIPDAALRWMLNFALPDTLQVNKRPGSVALQ